MSSIERYRIDHRDGYHPSEHDTGDTAAFSDRELAGAAMAENLTAINDLQQKLYAEKKEGVIFLFQAMDAAGKDGTIRAVLSCLSPHGVSEAAFKAPTSTELSHDFLWRIAQCVPAKGQIAIFNRSHYEDVLVGKVHRLYEQQARADRIDPDQIIETRYDDIRHWEEYLYHNSVRMVKIFLHVGKEEQAKRFLSRIEDPEKNWKFSAADMEERKWWDEYQHAFADAINATATKVCPWYVVPADHKWYMRWAVSQIIRETLEEMDPRWPVLPDAEKQKLDSYAPALRAELGREDRDEDSEQD